MTALKDWISWGQGYQSAYGSINQQGASENLTQQMIHCGDKEVSKN